MSLLIISCLFTITGCGPFDLYKEEENIITIKSEDKDYVTTFKSINNLFTQNPKYNQIHSEELSVFISFDYIESSKEEYVYAKTHNFFGYEYAEGTVKDYKWNNYSGYVGDEHTKDLDLTKDFDGETF